MHAEVTTFIFNGVGGDLVSTSRHVHEKQWTPQSATCMQASSTTWWHLLQVYLVPQMFAPQQAHRTTAKKNGFKSRGVATDCNGDGDGDGEETVAVADNGLSKAKAQPSHKALALAPRIREIAQPYSPKPPPSNARI